MFAPGPKNAISAHGALSCALRPAPSAARPPSPAAGARHARRHERAVRPPRQPSAPVDLRVHRCSGRRARRRCARRASCPRRGVSRIRLEVPMHRARSTTSSIACMRCFCFPCRTQPARRDRSRSTLATVRTPRPRGPAPRSARPVSSPFRPARAHSLSTHESGAAAPRVQALTPSPSSARPLAHAHALALPSIPSTPPPGGSCACPHAKRAACSPTALMAAWLSRSARSLS